MLKTVSEVVRGGVGVRGASMAGVVAGAAVKARARGIAGLVELPGVFDPRDILRREVRSAVMFDGAIVEAMLTQDISLMWIDQTLNACAWLMQSEGAFYDFLRRDVLYLSLCLELGEGKLPEYVVDSFRRERDRLWGAYPVEPVECEGLSALMEERRDWDSSQLMGATLPCLTLYRVLNNSIGGRIVPAGYASDWVESLSHGDRIYTGVRDTVEHEIRKGDLKGMQKVYGAVQAGLLTDYVVMGGDCGEGPSGGGGGTSGPS